MDLDLWQRVLMRHPISIVGSASLIVVAMLAAACSDDATNQPAPPATADSSATTEPQATTTTAAPVFNLSLRCDPLDEHACLLPWPNNAFTVPDASTPTGRRLDLDPTSTPANADSVHIDPTDINRADGFSPGSAIVTYVPALDVDATGLAPSTDIGSSLDADAPVVVFDVTLGERVPYWAELDAQAPTNTDRLLIIHPASSRPEGHLIAGAMRQLRSADGELIKRSSAFQAALDGTQEPSDRSPALAELFTHIEQARLDPNELYLAWEFTVASQQSLSGRLLSIRNDAYAELGDDAPVVAVTSSTDTDSVRTIEGTIEVPNYLTGDGSPGSTFALGSDGLPERNTTQPTYIAPFRCLLPLADSGQVPTIVYGHGLLNSRSEVDALSFAAGAGLAAACATDYIGMSTEDIPNLAAILSDLSKFNQQADRMQQGQLNVQFLGRALNDPNALAALPEFQHADGSPIIAVGETQYVGNSQGGILGGASSAVSTEWQRVVLGVPGINYSLLLSRSSDWPQFQTIFDAAYTTASDRVLALQLAQLLWDRGENNGYAQHLTTNTYDGIPAKSVLLIEAFGDHQVANVSTEVLARTIGARVHRPSLGAGRSNDVEPQWGIDPIDPGTDAGASLYVWDFGTPAPPPVNRPPTDPEYGQDPHGAGSSEPLVLQQALTFLLTGQVPDVCAGAPCVSKVITG